jgi:hypothetical protein
MSGDWITIRGDDGRMRQVIDAPDTCPAGHETVQVQFGPCPQCHTITAVFWCATSPCRWRAAGASHYERDCTPGTGKDPAQAWRNAHRYGHQ